MPDVIEDRASFDARLAEYKRRLELFGKAASDVVATGGLQSLEESARYLTKTRELLARSAFINRAQEDARQSANYGVYQLLKPEVDFADALVRLMDKRGATDTASETTHAGDVGALVSTTLRGRHILGHQESAAVARNHTYQPQKHPGRVR
jgi:hypothetical protein|tara:strand:+ start:37063 stop:37515 length:453 start_codon:yes stop_codon:yes gene_type:complete